MKANATPAATELQKENPKGLFRWLAGLLPVVVRPRVFALKNRYKSKARVAAADLFAVCITMVLMVGLYVCTTNTLVEWHRFSTLPGDVAPTLSAMCLGLFGLILLSACVSAISSLYLGKDLGLLLASPLPMREILKGKITEITIATTWMVCIFSIPPYLAFGSYYHASALYFVCAPLVLGCFLLLAVLSGTALAVGVASILPARGGRNLFAMLFMVVLGLFITSLNATPNSRLLGELLQGNKPLWVTPSLNHPALPSTWLADILCLFLGFESRSPVLGACLLFGSILALWCALVFGVTKLHQLGYGRLSVSEGRSNASGLNRHSRRLSIPGLSRQTRAIVEKELFSFTRDISHTIQLGMLLTICIVYLLNFSRLESPTKVGVWALRAWDLIGVGASLVISSFITLSICARFVFPSVSMEGQSLWILQTAPITPDQTLRAKYACWYLPVTVISLVIFISGGLALALEPIWLAALALFACTLAHGLVCLGLGLGARFARFDWEHPTELSTSWGSLLFIVCGFVLNVVSVMPLLVIFGVYVFMPQNFTATSALATLVGCGLAVVLLVHLVTGKLAMKLGARALCRAFEQAS
jgi:ABC-2 type transport system permease protein